MADMTPIFLSCTSFVIRIPQQDGVEVPPFFDRRWIGLVPPAPPPLVQCNLYHLPNFGPLPAQPYVGVGVGVEWSGVE